MTFLSPAKLNLGLKVVGKRQNGYHLLKTIFCLIDLFDEIQIQLTSNGKISLIEHRQVWPYDTDLAYRAAVLLKQESATSLGANIKVRKTIPSGGGLGGGSSNAATVLCVLNNLWQLNYTQEQLMELGRKLGADIPFFIHGKNSVATGIGDVFEDIELPQQYFALVCPKFNIKTAQVFQQLKCTDTDPTIDIDNKALLEALENDLMPCAIQIKPQMVPIIERLNKFGKVAMTGSGSSLFISFSDLDEAKKVIKKIAENSENQYNTFLVKSLAVSPICSNNF